MDGLIKRCYDKINNNKHINCKSSLGDDCFHCSSNMYFDGNDVSYECEHKRYIYIVRYLPVHSSEILNTLSQLLMTFYDEIKGKDKEKIVFASFGTGPGIDTHAFHRWLDRYRDDIECKDITAFRIESCEEWIDLAKDVMFSNSPLNLDRVYYRYIADVTKKDVKLKEGGGSRRCHIFISTR